MKSRSMLDDTTRTQIQKNAWPGKDYYDSLAVWQKKI